MNRNVVLVSVGVVLLLAAVAIYAKFGRGASLPDRFEAHGVCLATGQDVLITCGPNDRDPFQSPHSGKKTAYRWYYCYECKKKFVPELVRHEPGEPPRIPIGIRCPICQGKSVDQYLPDLPTQDADAPRAPLPRWEE